MNGELALRWIIMQTAKREEVEKLVRELMEGETDKKMREKVMD